MAFPGNGNGANLSDRVGVVVGASGGWGQGTSRALAERGARVVACGRSAERLAPLVDAITSGGGSAVACVAQADEAAGADRIVAAALETFGGIDILVNTTGGKVPSSIQDCTDDAFDYSVQTQLRAPFVVTARVARHMIQAGRGGRIINLCGGAAVRALPGESLHAATKGAVLAATFCWAAELEPFGITVNAVRGGVRSPGTAELIRTIRRRLGDAGSEIVTDRELGFFEPEEGAPLIVWLASDAAAGITGQFIGIDGPKLTVWAQAQTSVELLNRGGWSVADLTDFATEPLVKETSLSKNNEQVIAALQHARPPSDEPA
jgi:NAD(P)-dependent dehydrogenase (short-subunit alcohol dehydrogenase family)